MNYLICYDVADDHRRDRIAKTLLDYGRRVQESVFFATLDEELTAELVRKLDRVVDGDEDSLMMVAVCGSCQARVRIMGHADLPQDADFYVV